MLTNLRTSFHKLQGARENVLQNIEKSENKITEKEKSLSHHFKAREIIRTVGLETQKQLEYHISSIVSLAEDSVFDDAYEFEAQFVERRNKTECDLFFKRGEHTMKPIDSSGLGAVDVAGFSLRVASWNMENPKSRAVIIMDEPFKHLKGFEQNVKVIAMVKQLSRKLGLQIIMVHDERVSFEEIEKGADKIFKVTKNRNVSKVENYEI